MDNLQNEDSATSESRLMRLVDGELSSKERHDLLRSLDNEQDGWRRCAAMFLEDQSLRTALAPVDENRVDAVTRPAVSPVKQQAPAPVAKDVWPYNWKSLLALAAMLMAAFLFGMSANVNNPSGESGFYPAIPSTDFADDQTAGQLASPQNVRMVAKPNWKDTPNALFVQDKSFWDNESVIPHSVRQSLGRLGRKVDSQRGWVSMQTDDGREVSIPYEEVIVTPVSSKSY